jgi:hypothetical protein
MSKDSDRFKRRTRHTRHSVDDMAERELKGNAWKIYMDDWKQRGEGELPRGYSAMIVYVGER